MGSIEGVIKIAAKRLGLSVEEYKNLRAAGLKRCTTCKNWKPDSLFNKDRGRGDGLAAKCRDCHYRRVARTHNPKINKKTGRPGPERHKPRDGDKIQARQKINLEIRTGRAPHPNNLPCVDCGHVWSKCERRHEYDHYKGYDSEHHMSVEPVCTICHRRRADERGEINQKRDKKGRYKFNGKNDD